MEINSCYFGDARDGLRQIKAAFATPERIPADGVTDPDPPAPDR